jgi:hypothetical protein
MRLIHPVTLRKKVGAFWVQIAPFCGDLPKYILKVTNEGIDHNFMK